MKKGTGNLMQYDFADYCICGNANADLSSGAISLNFDLSHHLRVCEQQRL